MCHDKGNTSKTKCFILSLFFIAYVSGVIYGFLTGIDGISTDGLGTEKIHEIDSLYEKDRFHRALYILYNNSIVCLKIFCLGIFSFGVISGILVFLNAYILGLVFGYYSLTYDFSDLIQVVLPHSIEILGVILSGYAGFCISMLIILNRKFLDTKQTIYLFLIIIFSITTSAFLESYVSMQ